MQQFVEAAKAGDAERLIAALPEKQGKAFKNWLDAAAAAESTTAFRAALQRKFGANPSFRKIDYDRKMEVAEDITAVEVIGGKIEPDANQRAEFIVKITTLAPQGQNASRERTFIAQKVAAGWTVYPADLAEANYATGSEFLTKLTQTLDQTTKDVLAGKFKTWGEAQAAVEKKVIPSISTDMPIPRYMSQTKAVER